MSLNVLFDLEPVVFVRHIQLDHVEAGGVDRPQLSGAGARPARTGRARGH